MIATINGRTLYPSVNWREVRPRALVAALEHASTVSIGDWPAAMIGYDVDGRPYLDADVSHPDPCPIEIVIARGDQREALAAIALAPEDVAEVRS